MSFPPGSRFRLRLRFLERRRKKDPLKPIWKYKTTLGWSLRKADAELVGEVEMQAWRSENIRNDYKIDVVGPGAVGG